MTDFLAELERLAREPKPILITPEELGALVKCARALEQAADERDRIAATVEAMNTEDTPMAIPGNPYRDALADLERAAEGKG